MLNVLSLGVCCQGPIENEGFRTLLAYILYGQRWNGFPNLELR